MLTRYVWDYATNTCLAEVNEQGETTVEYTVNPQTGELISERRDGEDIYHHYDGDGNTRQTTDSDGNVLGEATYDAFGEIVAESGDMKTTYRFRGQQGCSTDPLTGDVSRANQNYFPSLGRNLSPSSYRVQDNGILNAAFDHSTTTPANYSTSLYSPWGAAFRTGLGVGTTGVSRHLFLAAWWQYPPIPYKSIHRAKACHNQLPICRQLRDIWGGRVRRILLRCLTVGCPGQIACVAIPIPRAGCPWTVSHQAPPRL